MLVYGILCSKMKKYTGTECCFANVNSKSLEVKANCLLSLSECSGQNKEENQDNTAQSVYEGTPCMNQKHCKYTLVNYSEINVLCKMYLQHKTNICTCAITHYSHREIIFRKKKKKRDK